MNRGRTVSGPFWKLLAVTPARWKVTSVYGKNEVWEGGPVKKSIVSVTFPEQLSDLVTGASDAARIRRGLGVH